MANPPPGAERYASEIGLAVGNFLQWIAPPVASWRATEFILLFEALLTEARFQADAHKFPVRLTGLDQGRITITLSRNDGKPVGPVTVSLEGEL